MDSKRYTFPSLRNPGTCYTLHTDTMALWDSAYHATRPIDPACGQYDTCGDGATQHSPEWAVSGNDPAVFADYCASLATFLASTDFASEDMDRVSFVLAHFECDDSREAITFALSVKYVEGKTRYYCKADRKVSARESLQYDKRWHKVDDSHDGSPRSAYWILHHDDSVSTLRRFANHEKIGEVASDLGYGYYHDTFRRIWGDHNGEIPDSYRDVSGRVHEAWIALHHMITSLLSRKYALRTLEAYDHNNKRREEREQSNATETAA